MTRNMIFIVLAMIAFGVAKAASADENVCDIDLTWEEAKAVSTYKHQYEVDFNPEGTGEGNLFCWLGNTNINIAIEEPETELVEVPHTCAIYVEADEDVVTLNCFRDVTLDGGETVMVQYTRVLHD